MHALLRSILHLWTTTTLLAIYGGKSPDRSDLCKGLYFCKQAYVAEDSTTLSYAYVTVSQASSAIGQDASNLALQAFTKKGYIDGIGENAIKKAFQRVVIPNNTQWIDETGMCMLENVPPYSHMSVSGVAIGLSPRACNFFLQELKLWIIKQQMLFPSETPGGHQPIVISGLLPTPPPPATSPPPTTTSTNSDGLSGVDWVLIGLGISVACGILLACCFECSRQSHTRRSVLVSGTIVR